VKALYQRRRNSGAETSLKLLSFPTSRQLLARLFTLGPREIDIPSIVHWVRHRKPFGFSNAKECRGPSSSHSVGGPRRRQKDFMRGACRFRRISPDKGGDLMEEDYPRPLSHTPNYHLEDKNVF